MPPYKVGTKVRILKKSSSYSDDGYKTYGGVIVGFDQFVKGLRTGLERAGIDAQGYKGHSLRRGSASWAFAHGVPGELIQFQGGWASQIYRQYLELSLETKLSITAVFTPSIYNLQA